DEEGETVTLEATITDSSGKVATTSIDVDVAAAPVTPPAVTPPAPAPTPTPVVGPPTISGIEKDKEKGTAMMAVTLPGAGKVTIFGFGVKKVTKSTPGPAEFVSLIKATGKKLKTLNKTGKVTVKVKIKFTAADGTVGKKTKSVTLVKK
ncbi:MAG: hypothetical protein AB7T48_04855, partial [Solirubrobacterales bacterium]